MKSLEQKAVEISKYLEEYFNITKRNEAKPKDVITFLIKKGVFNKDHKNGLPLREVFRALERSRKLHLIPQVIPEYKNKNISWLIVPVAENKIQSRLTEDTSTKPKCKLDDPVKSKNDDSDYLPTVTPGSQILNMRSSSVKLIPVANLIKQLLEEKFKKSANYLIGKVHPWLPCTPRKENYSNHWNIICDLYENINGYNLKLEDILKAKKNELLLSCQEIDIWFGEPYNLAVEFDEEQHFNQFRRITLEYYENLNIYFDLGLYKKLSQVDVKPGKKNNGFKFLHKKPDPLFPPSEIEDAQDNRIRQRAFRDFLKDITPLELGFNPTLRICFRETNNKIKDFTEGDLKSLMSKFIERNIFSFIKVVDR